MTPTRQGSFRLFQFAGINVYLHWSWFLVAVYAVSVRSSIYSSMLWNLLEYLALFLIVLIHEFGHALACRQVGGRADQIVLWPLGGVAYVAPPQRPGPVLWSIAAGPLVNLILLPLLSAVVLLVRPLAASAGWAEPYQLVQAIWIINLILLIFNLLPIYPLDGGQILRALLWFILGSARSLQVTTIIGFFGVAAMVALALWLRSIWFGILSAFILINCWKGWQQAQVLLRFSQAARRPELSCPKCHTSPPAGEFWMCGQCREKFDTFAHQGSCPNCHTEFGVASCPECGTLAPIRAWVGGQK